MRLGLDHDPEPGPYLWLMDPDPGGPKTTDPADLDPDPQHCFVENVR
jgi:hypothetical protein